MGETGELLMNGASASTYRLHGMVVKVPRIDTEAELTQENARAMILEANVYRMLGTHARIAQCLYASPDGAIVTLQYYPNGNLRQYAAAHGLQRLCKWGRQMIEGVQFIHSKGVRHSDIRLDQWLVDDEVNARLSDFNASGHDMCRDLGIEAAKAVGVERASHFMPQDPCEDNTVRSDLFAMGSALYELEHAFEPFAGLNDETITQRFLLRHFPSVTHLRLGILIMRCWQGQYSSASETLEEGEQFCGF